MEIETCKDGHNIVRSLWQRGKFARRKMRNIVSSLAPIKRQQNRNSFITSLPQSSNAKTKTGFWMKIIKTNAVRLHRSLAFCFPCVERQWNLINFVAASQEFFDTRDGSSEKYFDMMKLHFYNAHQQLKIPSRGGARLFFRNINVLLTVHSFLYVNPNVILMGY